MIWKKDKNPGIYFYRQYVNFPLGTTDTAIAAEVSDEMIASLRSYRPISAPQLNFGVESLHVTVTEEEEGELQHLQGAVVFSTASPKEKNAEFSEEISHFNGWAAELLTSEGLAAGPVRWSPVERA